jgi:AcrR family transcriptional regulator
MVQSLPRDSSAAGPRAQHKQLEILAAASRVFRRQGLHATGMREIAAESGMHVGNLYYYFRNKQELLAFCQKQTLSGLLELAETIRRQPSAADAKLYRLVVGHVVRLNEEMPGSLAHLEVEALEGRWRDEILRQRDRYESAICAFIEEGIETGLFRQVDPGVTAKAILGALNWTVKWFQTEGAKTSGEIGAEFAELLVRGLLAPGEQASFRTPTPESGGIDVECLDNA